MSDLIDREALLEAMKHRKEYYGRKSDPICLVEDAPSIPAPRWVRCDSGELPEIGKRVLLSAYGDIVIVTRTENEISQGRRYWKEEGDGYWYRIEDDYYWMPIPEPPKEGV